VDDIGKKATRALWPVFFSERGSAADRQGIDGWMKGSTFQLKTDVEIARTGNLYYEVQEKDKGHPLQPWRRSPSAAILYIFISRSLALLVPKRVLLEVAKGAPFEPNPTSRGYLIPIRTLQEGTGYYGVQLPRRTKEALAKYLEPLQGSLV